MLFHAAWCDVVQTSHRLRKLLPQALSLSVLALLMMPVRIAAQSEPVGSGTESAGRPENSRVDVVIFVNPVSQDAVNLGIAYSRMIPHGQVKKDIVHLLQASGWKLGSTVGIDDASNHPGSANSPRTTAIEMNLVQAPQIRQSVPDLLPYLQAFQRFDHVEVNFILPPLNPDLTQDLTTTDQYVARLLSRDRGVYRYETTLLDHKGVLAPLPRANSPYASEKSTLVAVRPQGSAGLNVWAFWVAMTGLILLGISGLFFWLQRKAAHRDLSHSSSRQ